MHALRRTRFRSVFATGILFLLAETLTAQETNTPPRPSPSPPANPGNQLEYTIIVTGGELLRGIYPDSHTQFITRTLHPIGCRCLGSMSVDDQPEALKQALQFATGKARLVIVTGGLGPTVNDITRETLAEFTGIPLQEHPQALAEMERRFGQPRDQLRANLRRQTQVPTRGSFLPNPYGTAVGLVFETEHHHIVALPGPPRELHPMVDEQLLPYLRQTFGTRLLDCALTLRFVGVGQSLIDQTLRDHVPVPADVVISSLFEGGRVDFTFALPQDTEENRARLTKLGEQLRQHLEPHFYADDGSSLEEQVLKMLETNGATLALVEVGSGGHVADCLNAARRAAPPLNSACVAPTEEKLRQILPVTDEDWSRWKPGPERLQGFGTAAAKLTRSTWTVVVGPVETIDGRNPFVQVAVGSLAHKWDFGKIPLRDSGELAHTLLTTQIIERLRQSLRQAVTVTGHQGPNVP